MRNFITVKDMGNLGEALEKARFVKENPYADVELGRNKTMLLPWTYYGKSINRAV